MEAVRMPMTSFDFKAAADPCLYLNLGLDIRPASESTTFTKPLLEYITRHYGESAKAYLKPIQELEALRRSAVDASRDFVGCATLKKYYAQLNLVQSRFPMKEGEPASVLFAWDDPFSGNAYEAMDIRFEQSCVLYNIGALHSALGSMETRQSSDGMKISCTHFQCAAWAFQHLAKGFDCSTWSPDMNAFVMEFMSTLMLAQAQECILEKSMLDQRKNTIIAKVAAQIVDYYDNQLTKSLESEVVSKTLGSKKIKEYKKLISVKTPFYKSIAHFFQGNQSQEQQKHGEAVAHFQIAADSLAEAVKAATKGGSLKETPSLAEALSFASDVVGGKVTSAKKDNDFIYHDRIPEPDSLPEIKGASLVKPIPFDPSDPDISGPDIFAQLVPMKVHEAASLYSEEVAKLLRQVGDEIEEKNAELDEFLTNLDLDAVRSIEEREKVPQELLERCASMSVRDKPVDQIIGQMKTLSGLSCDVKDHLESLKSVVESCPPDAPGAGGAADVESEMKHYVEAHSRADASNLELNRAMQAHLGNLRLLAGNLDQLVAELPKLDGEKMKEDPAVAEMLRLAGKLEYMKESRGELEKQLREKLNKRDVTKELVVMTGDKEKPDPEELNAFFKKVLSDYDKDVEILRQNLSAQVNVLNAVTEANAAYTAVRKQMTEKQQRRDAMIKSLMKSYDMYEDLATKSQKGIDFYQKLLSNINKLLDKLSKRMPKKPTVTAGTDAASPLHSNSAAASPAANTTPISTPTHVIAGVNANGFPSGPSSSPALPDPPTDRPSSTTGVAGPPSALSAPLPETGLDAASMMSMLAAEGVTSAGGAGLKLKDLLPYMKPERFGGGGGGRERKSPAKTLDAGQSNLVPGAGMPAAGVPPGMPPVHPGAPMAQPGVVPAAYPPTQPQFPRPPPYEISHMYPPMIQPGGAPGQHVPGQPSQGQPANTAVTSAIPLTSVSSSGVPHPVPQQPTHSPAAAVSTTVASSLAQPGSQHVAQPVAQSVSQPNAVPTAHPSDSSVQGPSKMMQPPAVYPFQYQSLIVPPQGHHQQVHPNMPPHSQQQLPPQRFPNPQWNQPYGQHQQQQQHQPQQPFSGAQPSQVHTQPSPYPQQPQPPKSQQPPPQSQQQPIPNQQQQIPIQQHQQQPTLPQQQSSHPQQPLLSQHHNPTESKPEAQPLPQQLLPSQYPYAQQQLQQPHFQPPNSHSISPNHGATPQSSTAAAPMQPQQIPAAVPPQSTSASFHPQQNPAAGQPKPNVAASQSLPSPAPLTHPTLPSQQPPASQPVTQPSSVGYPLPNQHPTQHSIQPSSTVPPASSHAWPPHQPQAAYRPPTPQSLHQPWMQNQAPRPQAQSTQSTQHSPAPASGVQYPPASSNVAGAVSQPTFQPPLQPHAGSGQPPVQPHIASGQPPAKPNMVPVQPPVQPHIGPGQPYLQSAIPSSHSFNPCGNPSVYSQAGGGSGALDALRQAMAALGGPSTATPQQQQPQHQQQQPQQPGQVQHPPQTGPNVLPTSNVGLNVNNNNSNPSNMRVNPPQQPPTNVNSNPTSYPQSTPSNAPIRHPNGAFQQHQFYHQQTQPNQQTPVRPNHQPYANQQGFPQQTTNARFPHPGYAQQPQHNYQQQPQQHNYQQQQQPHNYQQQPQQQNYHQSANPASQPSQPAPVALHPGQHQEPATQSTTLHQAEPKFHQPIPPSTFQQTQQLTPASASHEAATSNGPVDSFVTTSTKDNSSSDAISNTTATVTPSLTIPNHARKSSLDDILSISSSPGYNNSASQPAGVSTSSSGSGGTGNDRSGGGAISESAAKTAPVLSPKIITSEEQSRLKEEKRLRRVQDRIPTAYTAAAAAVASATTDPSSKPNSLISLKSLETEARSFKEKVDNLTVYGADGWMRDVWSFVSKASSEAVEKKTKAVAKLASTKKNRGGAGGGILPFDQNRVVLRLKEVLGSGGVGGGGPGGTYLNVDDDYINASRVDELCESGVKSIVTALPTTASNADFLAMLVQEKVALVVTIANTDLFADSSTLPPQLQQQQQQQQSCPRFWPSDREEDKLQIGPFTVHRVTTPRERRCRNETALSSSSSSSSSASISFVERDLAIKFHNKEHLVTQFHLCSWPIVGLPNSPVELLAFINEINAHFFKMRDKTAPIVIQCLNGSGPSGIFSVTSASILHHLVGDGVPDLASLCVKANSARSHLVQDKEQLVFCYQALALHLEKYLLTKNIKLTNGSAAGDLSATTTSASATSSASSGVSRAASFRGSGASPRASPKSALVRTSGGSTPTAEDLFSENPVSFGQILSCVSGMTCRTSTAPTPPQEASPEAKWKANKAPEVNGVGVVGNGDLVNDAMTQIQPGFVNATTPTAAVMPSDDLTAPEPAESNGLTQKERKSKEEKEVAEEKDEGEGENQVVNGGVSSSSTMPSSTIVPSSLASALDPSQFTLKSEIPDVAPNLKKQKPGINAFLNRDKADTSDPFSTLDPIWSHKDC